tara:strand:+ start:398 stop:1537 length:1140 start_codon:yes stop_codon:yes gene_type:complete
MKPNRGHGARAEYRHEYAECGRFREQLQRLRGRFAASVFVDNVFYLRDSSHSVEEIAVYGALELTTTSLCTAASALVLRAQIPALLGMLMATWHAWQKSAAPRPTAALVRVVNSVVESILREGILVSLAPQQLDGVCAELKSTMENLRTDLSDPERAWVHIERLCMALKATERVPRLPLSIMRAFCTFLYSEERKHGAFWDSPVFTREQQLALLHNSTQFLNLYPQPTMSLAQLNGNVLADKELPKLFPYYKNQLDGLFELVRVLERTDQRLYALFTLRLYRHGLYRHRFAHVTSHDLPSGWGTGWAVHVPFRVDLVQIEKRETLPWLTATAALCDFTLETMEALVTAHGKPCNKRKRAEPRKAESNFACPTLPGNFDF